MRLEDKWKSLAKKVGGRIVSYYGDKYLHVARGTMEINHGDLPEHLRKYHLTLPRALHDKKIYLFDMENCGFYHHCPINTLTFAEINGDIIAHSLFALDYYGERPILRKSMNLLKKADLVFTYNGGAFDLDRMSRRMSTYGMFKEGESSDLKKMLGRRHCDLYPVVISFLSSQGKTLLDRKLQTLEKVFFETHREEEISGAEIPLIYDDFVNGPNGKGDEEAEKIVESMARVINHNTLDAITVGAALEYLKRNNYVPAILETLAREKN